MMAKYKELMLGSRSSPYQGYTAVQSAVLVWKESQSLGEEKA
jgi:hypothetical protein